MTSNKILGIMVPNEDRQSILEKIIKYINKPAGFFHIASLNPENLVVAQENDEFKKELNSAQIRLIDGVGVKIAARILGMQVGERYAGVDLMQDLLAKANKLRLRVMLIGGEGNLANEVVECQGKIYPEAILLGHEGFKNIRNPSQEEEKSLFSIVADFKPHIVFVSFGSPMQELWLARHKAIFAGMVSAGVGGAFEFLSGRTPRANKFFRILGLEWLFRLVVQPWRWRRQLRLVKFALLVFKSLS